MASLTSYGLRQKSEQASGADMNHERREKKEEKEQDTCMLAILIVTLKLVSRLSSNRSNLPLHLWRHGILTWGCWQRGGCKLL
jgi:hypothetical protein